jgi:formate hydrogenlyase subunit 3/multisubunit Na+/H+ antiporter MnhD subunit
MPILDANDILLLFLEVLVILCALGSFHFFFTVKGSNGKRSRNLLVRAISVNDAATAVLVIQLVWGRLNQLYGEHYAWSNELREFVLMASLVFILYAVYTKRQAGRNNLVHDFDEQETKVYKR